MSTAELMGFFPASISDTRSRITDLMKVHDMTQAQLAEKLNMSESALSRYLSGQTYKLSCEHVIAMAGLFNISTDYLLCLTDISTPSKYGIESLGMSVAAGEKLMRKKVDPAIVSMLIELPAFDTLIQRLGMVLDGTYAASVNYVTEMIQSTKGILSECIRGKQASKQAAEAVLYDMRGVRAAAKQADFSAVEDAMRAILSEFKKAANARQTTAQKLTSQIIKNITDDLKTQLADAPRQEAITPDMVISSVMNCLRDIDLSEDQQTALRSIMLSMMTAPGDNEYSDNAQQRKIS